MDGSIVLGSSQRKRLLGIYRGKEAYPAPVRLRAHVVLLLAEGHPWSLIAGVLFCSTATIARWRERFEAGGVDALLEERRGRAATLLVGWALVLVTWVRARTPRDFGFGYCRSRWCCATLALVLRDTHRVRVSAETVRCGAGCTRSRWSGAGRVRCSAPRTSSGGRSCGRSANCCGICRRTRRRRSSRTRWT